MIARLLSVWIAVTASVAVSFAVFLTAYWVGNLYDQTERGKPLPAISAYFYPPATALYYFPAALFCYALVMTAWFRRDADQCLLCCVVVLSLAIVFIAVSGFALALPFLPIKIYRLNP